MIPRIKGPQQGLSPTQDSSRTTTAEPISLDVVFKIFKDQGFENMDQRLQKQDQRFGNLDRRFEEQDLRQETCLNIFKIELREDLDERFEQFRQEIKSAVRMITSSQVENLGILHLKESCNLYNSSNNSMSNVNRHLHCMRHSLEFGPLPSREPVQEPRHLPLEVGSPILHSLKCRCKGRESRW